MGKIGVLCLLLLLSGCYRSYDDDYPCRRDLADSDTYIFRSTQDTLRVGESARFQVTRLNPKIEKLTTSERLPYPPMTELLIYAISDTTPPWADYTSNNYTYGASRPFRVVTEPGLSSYKTDSVVLITGQFAGDSVRFDFLLKALLPGLYKISWKYIDPDWFVGPGIVYLDSKKHKCGYYWQMIPEFETNQPFEPYELAFPGILIGEKRLNRFIHVLP